MSHVFALNQKHIVQREWVSVYASTREKKWEKINK